MICAYHDGYTNPNFEQYQNTSLLTKNLGALLECYKAVKLECNWFPY
jgi:hypothetical protein